VNSTNSTNPLVVATECYYWKPMMALFRALELRVYRESGVSLQGSVLDLGCGDGQVISMLKKVGVVQDQVGGLEISAREISKASGSKVHKWLLQASGNHLPFKDESFSSIISNSVLGGIPEGVSDLLREVHRVLGKEGTFVVTVPTDRFVDVLLVPKILERFSSRWRARQVRGLINRLPLYNAYAPQEWRRRLESVGFSVLKMEKYFSVKTGYLWSLFLMKIIRVVGLLKYVRIPCVKSGMSRILQIVCRKSYIHDQDDAKADFGYIFIVAKKK
jgi:ubiquinone/menaquinone biosynthesis C-methylase UbiE